MKALAGSQVTDAFVREFGGRHHLDDVEASPADVVAEHLKLRNEEFIVKRFSLACHELSETYVCQFGNSVGLDRNIVLA